MTPPDSPSPPFRSPTPAHRFELTTSWDGAPLRDGEWARAQLALPTGGRAGAGDETLLVRVEAAHHGDPAPPVPAGRLDGLWDFEVVELFLLGAGEEYLEIELGPHGHWLGLRLSGTRRVSDAAVAIAYSATRDAGRWSGQARIPMRWLPPGLRAANFYAIHGSGRERRFLAMHPVPGDAPDFHRLDRFGALQR